VLATIFLSHIYPIANPLDVRPFLMPLFTRVRGRGVLGSSAYRGAKTGAERWP
jgi:hypothetical protein